MANFISEDQIEQTLLQKLQHVHGYDVLDCHTDEREDLADDSGRASKRDGPNRTEGEAHGISVFFSLGDDMFHTYSSYARGVNR